MLTARMKAYIAILIGVITLSFSAIIVKLISASSGVTAFYRLLFTTLLLFPLFFFKYKHEWIRLEKKALLLAFIAGVFLAFHFILWFESLNYTSVASSTVLVTLQPLFAFVGAYFFFKERFSWKVILSAFIALGGSVIISWGDFRISGAALWGDILALTACGLITGYLLIGQSVRQQISSITYTFVVYFFSTVTLLVYVLSISQALLPYPLMDWIYFLSLAIFPTLLGHSLLNWSQKWISTTTISMAILLEPVGASILAYYIFAENMIWTQFIGGGVIVLGLVLFFIEERKKDSKAS